MKDLTRREIALLCAYGLVLVLGIAWIARSLTGGSPAAPVGSAPAAESEIAPRLLRARFPQASGDLAGWRCFATRACPPEDLAGILGMASEARWEGRLSEQDGEQSATFVGLPAEPLHVSLFAEGALAAVGLAGESVEELRLELDPARLAVRPARLSGGFQDASSASPLAGTLSVERDGEPEAVQALAADGRFDLVLPAPASVRLVARFPDRAAWRRDIRVSAGERVELGTIELPRAPSVRGELRREDGGPRAFPVLLERLDASTDGVPPERPLLTYSEPNGRFLFLPVAPGSYSLRVPAPDEGFPFPTPETLASRVLEIEVREGELADHPLDIEPVQPVRVQMPPEETGPLSYELRDSSGHLLRAARLDPFTPPSIQLTRGDYVLSLHGSEGERGRVDFEVDGGPNELLIEIPPLDH